MQEQGKRGVCSWAFESRTGRILRTYHVTNASYQGILTRRELSGFLAITEFTGMLFLWEPFFF